MFLLLGLLYGYWRTMVVAVLGWMRGLGIMGEEKKVFFLGMRRVE
jgi:3-oxoacyl-ACP reductase-like protein